MCECCWQVAAARKTVAALELRLGLRVRREPSSLWLWALRRVCVFRALGVDLRRTDPAAGRSGGGRGGVGREMELGTLEATLATLQKRRNHLTSCVDQASRRLHEVLDQYNLLQPAFLATEERLSQDTEAYDLSPARLSEAQRTLDALRRLREGARTRLLTELRHFASQANTSESELQATLAAAPGIDAESMRALTAARDATRAAALSPAMAAAQAELTELWGVLRLPPEQRARLAWTDGEPLDEAMLRTCQHAASRLEVRSARCPDCASDKRGPHCVHAQRS